MNTQHSFETVKPYVINFLKQHYWKVKNILSYDDAMGEAQLQFVRTIQRLTKNGNEIKNDAHLMSLFKTSWSRHFITLANKASKHITYTDMSDEAYDFVVNGLVGESDNQGFITVLMNQAPNEIKQVLALLCKIPEESINQIIRLLNRNQLKEANLLISTLLGLDSKKNVLQQTLNYLQ